MVIDAEQKMDNKGPNGYAQMAARALSHGQQMTL